ncbi:hypothetical protein EYF80_008048 [Liparis tanakae]|uniref:Uncharacterized protein n=1 Tax=Liparis tanakae TaxID=230148 RepID=A0A4Z2IWF3_9TELE|nr:hypothetical protein EYF80_008048 [Liparis tanakae]
MKAASRVRLCFPLPPTPTSSAFPRGDSRIRFIRQLHVELIKGLEVLHLHQLVSVHPVGLVQIDFQQVRRGFQALCGTEENALGGEGREEGLRVSFQWLICSIYNRKENTAQSLWVLRQDGGVDGAQGLGSRKRQGEDREVALWREMQHKQMGPY